MIRNVIFDWSGTLVDDLPAVWRATNFVLRRAGQPEMTLSEFRAEFCLPFAGFYDRFIPHVPLPQLEDWFHDHYRQVRDSVVELPHARDFLEFCRARRLRTFGRFLHKSFRTSGHLFQDWYMRGEIPFRRGKFDEHQRAIKAHAFKKKDDPSEDGSR